MAIVHDHGYPKLPWQLVACSRQIAWSDVEVFKALGPICDRRPVIGHQLPARTLILLPQSEQVALCVGREGSAQPHVGQYAPVGLDLNRSKKGMVPPNSG